MNSYTCNVELGFEVSRGNLKCPESFMFSCISNVEVGLEDLCESPKRPARLMISYTSKFAVGLEALSENLKCPEGLMFSYISNVEVGFEDFV